MSKGSKKKDHFEELMDALARPPDGGRQTTRKKKDVTAGREEVVRCMALPCADLTCPCRVVNKKG